MHQLGITAVMVVAMLGLGRPSAARVEENATDTTTIYVVRHAERDEEKDALTTVGLQRAEALRWVLHAVPLDAVYSTSTRRTRETAGPVAEAKHLVIEDYDGRKLVQTVTNIKHRGRTILMVGHSDTIPNALRRLGFNLEARLLAGNDDLFVIILHWDQNGELKGKDLYRLKYPSTAG